MAETRYYLGYTDSGTDYYYFVDGSGNVDTTTTITKLTYAPKDKDSSKITEERKFTYHGVYRKYSNPVKFVRDGAQILRHIFANQGINGVCWLRIAVFDNSVSVNDFVEQYRGDIDFSRYNSARYEVSVEMMEDGFPSRLVSKETTEFELEMADSSEKIWVKIPSIKLKFKQRWICQENESLSDLPPTPSYHYVPTSIPTLSEGTNLVLSTYDQDLAIGDLQAIENNTDNTITISLTINYNCDITMSGGTSGKFEVGHGFYNVTNPGTIISHIVDYVEPTTMTGPGATNKTGEWTTTSIVLTPGQGIIVEYGVRNLSGALIAPAILWQNAGFFTVSIDNDTPEFYVPMRSMKSVATELVNEIGEDTTFESDLLETDFNNLYLVSGDALINLPHSKLKTTFADFYKSVNGILCTTMQYDRENDICRIEAREESYDEATTIIDVGSVSGMTYTPLVEEQWTNLKIGYENQTYDDINGKDEPNQTTSYKSPLRRTLGDKEYKSSYRGDHYGVVFHCMNLNNKTETDSDPDNNIWVVDVDIAGGTVGTIPTGYTGAGEPYYNVYIDGNLDITNVYSGNTYFNVNLSPARNFIRHEKYFSGLFWNLGSEDVTFQSASKSNYTGSRMSTYNTITSETISEDQDFTIGDFPAAYFKPIIFEFTCIVDNDFKTAVEASPYGIISFVHNGDIFYGYILKVEYSVGRPEQKTLQLLCTSSTDTDQLIY